MTDAQLANHTKLMDAHKIVIRAYDHLVNQGAIIKTYNPAEWRGTTGTGMLQARYILAQTAEAILVEARSNIRRSA